MQRYSYSLLTRVIRQLCAVRGGHLLVAVDALAALVAFLRLDRQSGDRAGFEPLEGDRLAGLLAIAVGAVLDAGEGGVDLRDQLALAIAGAQLDGAVRLR